MPGNSSADVLDRSEALKGPQKTKIFISTKPWAQKKNRLNDDGLNLFCVNDDACPCFFVSTFLFL